MAQGSAVVKITFLDGTVERYEFVPPEHAEWTRSAKVEKLLTGNALVFECEGTVKMIPLSSVRSVELSPAPPPYPPAVVPGFKRMA